MNTFTRLAMTEMYERWNTSVLDKGETVEVFVQPTRDELLDIADSNRMGSIRFVADARSKELYAWNGEHLHGEITDKALPQYDAIYSSDGDPDVMFGEGIFTGKKILLTNASGITFTLRVARNLVPEAARERLRLHGLYTDWSWADRWLDWQKTFEEWKSEAP